MYPDPSVTDRLPPHNRDAERSLLSSMLRDNNIINDIVHLVKADHFYVCSVCGQAVDIRQLADVLYHEELTHSPKPVQ